MIKKILNKMLENKYCTINYFGWEDEDKTFFKRISGLGLQGRNLSMRGVEAVQLIKLVKSIRKLKGVIVEAGAYRGYSSLLIGENKEDKRKLYCFDTYEGFVKSEMNENDLKGFKEKDFDNNSYETVCRLLKHIPNCKVIKGNIKETLKQVDEIALANLDLDLGEPTLNALKIVYGKMQKNGIIVFHDYQFPTGEIKRVVEDFMKDKPETIIELAGGTQAIIVKS